MGPNDSANLLTVLIESNKKCSKKFAEPQTRNQGRKVVHAKYKEGHDKYEMPESQLHPSFGYIYIKKTYNEYFNPNKTTSALSRIACENNIRYET